MKLHYHAEVVEGNKRGHEKKSVVIAKV